MIDFDLIYQSLPSLLRGGMISIKITAIAIIIGFVLGTILGLLERAQYRIIQILALVYMTIFRGTPMLVQILFIYYVLPQFSIVIDPFWSASIAIGLNSSAYISQIVQSGINGVAKGQFEAAKCLGLNYFQTMRFIVLPQAFRIVLPALGNELITLVKDSSLASIIGVMELSKEASIIRSRTYDAFSILLAISVIYLVITAFLTYCTNRLVKAYNIHV